MLNVFYNSMFENVLLSKVFKIIFVEKNFMLLTTRYYERLRHDRKISANEKSRKDLGLAYLRHT